MLNSLLSILILFSVKESKIAVSCPFGKGPGEVGIMRADMIYGPQDFEVDWEENIYVLDNFNDRRIMKFDSTGKLLFIITEPESIVPISLAVDTKNNLIVSATTHRKTVLARYSPNGELLRISSAPGAGARSLMSDLKGQIYARFTDYVVSYDEEFNYITTLTDKRIKRQGYAQWTHWIWYKKKKDTATGKYNIGLKNLDTKQELAPKLAPGRITYGYIEGMDKKGNVYTAGIDCSNKQRIFFRINPITQAIDTLRVEHTSGGDLAHARFVSPNGEIYKASIVYEANKPKWYRIYRYSKNLFARME